MHVSGSRFNLHVSNQLSLILVHRGSSYFSLITGEPVKQFAALSVFNWTHRSHLIAADNLFAAP